MNFQLRQLSILARLSLTCLVLVNLGGYLASGLHMKEHHQNRDGREGLAATDIEGVYHGVTMPARMNELLEANHPTELGLEALNPDDLSELKAWVTGENIAENWGNIDFGEGFGSPEEITAMACGKCHGPAVNVDERAEPLLGTWDHYDQLVNEYTVSPTDEAVLLASTHAHAIALATITLLICMLMYGTRLPEFMKGGLCFLASGGLLFDLAAWWLARESASFVAMILAGGAAHAGAMGLMMVLILGDLWFPKRP